MLEKRKIAAEKQQAADIGASSSDGDAEAVIVVRGHVPDQVDLPGEVLPHRVFAILAALAWRQEDVVGLVDRAGHPGLDWQAGLDPSLRAAGEGQHRN